MVQPDSGEMIFRGKKIKINTPADAINAEIGMVHQHFKLIESFTVEENLLLGIEPKKWLFIDKKKRKELLELFLKKTGIDLPLKKKVKDCSSGIKQLIEISKTLLRGASLIILDEPTSLLTKKEINTLFKIIEEIKKRSKTLILITHKLDEAFAIGDFITLMKDGKVIKTFSNSSSKDHKNEITKTLSLHLKIPQKNMTEIPQTRREVIHFKEINFFKKNRVSLKDITFSANSSQIVGFAGAGENGQKEIIDIIMGYENKSSGVYELLGKVIEKNTIHAMRKLNVAYIPSERINQGSDINLSLSENLISTTLDSNHVFSNHTLDNKKIQRLSKQLMKDFFITAKDPGIPLKSFSGGNIQKTILARELSGHSPLIVADNPTSGLDYASSSFIKRMLQSKRDNGASILLFSNELKDLIELSDKIIVLFRGEITGLFHEVKNLSEEQLEEYIIGKNRMRL